MTTLEKFQAETVPILVKRWPEIFSVHGGELMSRETCGECDGAGYIVIPTHTGPERDHCMYCGDEGVVYEHMHPLSLDSIAAMSKACWVVTEAFRFNGRWLGRYTLPPDNWYITDPFDSEEEARLAAFIAAVAALDGEA